MKTEADRKSFVLAIDLGTSSTKSALFDSRGNRILETMAQRAYPLDTDAAGKAELLAKALAEAFEACVGESIEAGRALHGGTFHIEAVGVSCFWHGLMGLDAKGKPVTEVITWADSRCREDAEELRGRWDEKAIHRATGCMVRSSYWPAKLMWLRRTNARLFKRVARWVSPAEWLMERWCGVGRCAVGMATGTGLFRPDQLRWDVKILSFLGIDTAQLNPVGDEPLATSSAIQERYPELKEARWFPAIGDGAASNLGSGAVEPGLAALNLGTSAALRVMLRGTAAKAPFGLFCYRVDPERYLIGGAISNAGNLRAWCLRELKLSSDADELERALVERKIPQHGLTILPFWVAERAPFWREEMPSMVMGLNPGTTALDILQATTEAVYYRLALIAETVRKATGDIPQIIVSGGAQKSPASMRRLANILNQPVYPSEESEASLRGAAVFALEKIGAKVDQFKPSKPVRPERKIAAVYASAFAMHRALEERLG
ncbi:unnamed protein product [uncultured bacterium]|nr:unnamed protein product [uncultured bacterium]